MKYVIKAHIECDSPLDAQTLEQVIHERLRTSALEGSSLIQIDESETFVVATNYDDYAPCEE